MDKIDKRIALGTLLVGLTYTIGGVTVICCNENKTIKMMDDFHDKCKITQYFIDEKFGKHEITEDEWVELNDEVNRIRLDYINDVNKITDDNSLKYGIINSIKATKSYTRITKKYTKMIDKVWYEIKWH